LAYHNKPYFLDNLINKSPVMSDLEILLAILWVHLFLSTGC